MGSAWGRTTAEAQTRSTYVGRSTLASRPFISLTITLLVCMASLVGLCSCAQPPEAPIDVAAWATHGPLQATVISIGEESGEDEILQSLQIVAPQSPSTSDMGVASVYYDKSSVTVAPDIKSDYASPEGELPLDALLLMDAKVRIELEKRGDSWWAGSVFIERVE